MAPPGCAHAEPSGVRMMHAVSVKRTSTSRSSFRASTRCGWPETSGENPLLPLQRNINALCPCCSLDAWNHTQRRSRKSGIKVDRGHAEYFDRLLVLADLDPPVRTGFDFVQGCVTSFIEGHGEIQETIDVYQRLADGDFPEGTLIGRQRVFDEHAVVIYAHVQRCAQCNMQAVEQRFWNVCPDIAILHI